jgi:2-dehydropantoate 2-reductase
VRIAVLGPGGVGGLLAGALDRAGTPVVVVATESTAAVIRERGLRVQSVSLGRFVAHPESVDRLQEGVDAVIVATKASGLEPAIERIAVAPRLVLPVLNGLEHLAVLRERFPPDSVLAGAIRVEADRPAPGEIVHTSPFLLVDLAMRNAGAAIGSRQGPSRTEVQALANTLRDAGVPARVLGSEAQVMWSKLVRLNALACTTSAFDKLLGEIRDTPELYADLVKTIEEGCAVGRAEGAEDVDPATALAELNMAHATLGSSMQRDIAAGRLPELDAIPGAVLRAAARHGVRCPTIERLVAVIAERAQVPPPVLAA